MTILAKTITGKEFIYSARSAHKVNKKNAEKIAECLNNCGFMLKDGEKWHVYEVDQYDNAFIWAEDQTFYITKGGALKRKASY